MKSILVTGATGFIGTHLLPILLERGWQVTAAVRRDRVELPQGVRAVKVGHIDGSTDWQDALAGIDTVIHLAARAHILNDTTTDPEAEFYAVNVAGTQNLVQQCVATGIQHFVFVSSIGAMATLSNCILSEQSPCQPDTPYGRSKLKAEQVVQDLTRGSSMSWTILRPTLVYGPGNPGNMARLIGLVQRRLPLPFAKVHNRRSFVYVGNLTDAIATCLSHPHARNQIFLVSDEPPLSTPELMQRIARQLGVPLRLLPVPPAWLRSLGSWGDRLETLLGRSLPVSSRTIERLLGSLVADSSQIRGRLNWHPPFSWEQGLAATLAPVSSAAKRR